jgi:hypothetical protein
MNNRDGVSQTTIFEPNITANQIDQTATMMAHANANKYTLHQ